MKEQIETEIKALIDIAWTEYDLAIALNDSKAANIWKSEAFDLLSKLPENMVMLKDIQ